MEFTKFKKMAKTRVTSLSVLMVVVIIGIYLRHPKLMHEDLAFFALGVVLGALVVNIRVLFITESKNNQI
jgi:hypothetical protein